MYIKSVLSHFGGWQTFQTQYAGEYFELLEIMDHITVDEKDINIYSKEPARHNYSPVALHGKFDLTFKKYSWIPANLENRITLGNKTEEAIHYTQLDTLKNTVGIDVNFGKYSFAESSIFVKFPIFIQSGRIKIAVLLLPSRELQREMTPGVSSIEMISNRIKALTFLPVKYPLAILGMTHLPVEKMDVVELTSPLDCYLNERIGYTLPELKLQAENQNYDFKRELSPENDKVAKEICALANLIGGGYLLIGIEDNGDICGIDRENLDEIEQRIANITHNKVLPTPEIEFQVFDVPENINKCVLVTRIKESRRKPCMTNDKVYIRSGNIAIAAKSEDVRKLVLGIEDQGF